MFHVKHVLTRRIVFPLRRLARRKTDPARRATSEHRLFGRFGAGFGIALLAMFASTAAWVHSLGPVPLGESLEFSTDVVDRNGLLLRPYATVDGRWRLPATVTDVDPRYLDLLIAYEDKRFRSHVGVDPLAVRPKRSGRYMSSTKACGCT